MKITNIEKAKATRYTISVDNEYWYILDLEIIMQNHLKIGMEVDEDFLDDIKMQAERRKARERAYYLLGYRDHSKKELYDKLLESARPEIAFEILSMVEEQGLINDENYARKLARYYLEQKNWGEKRAVYEMYKKGIDKELAEIAIEECDVDVIQQISKIIDKKYYLYMDDFKGKQKVIAALMRLGYSYDDVKAAINNYE
ncbi:RecX family transcriptional regulator [Paludicola sp. MB14-C6]|uniref:regulatory protein RecX n=1 Tax=Paludihabitans sp. MB14-C6 TaxID=3070656 RepID=UPI0027DBEC3E|nr:RecX family transcriptional regulator [Paludicola sp. MB14-C6]WMJ22452.1 RecX family transcriptional regulator [Paludicola sp. MB14-C6]